MGLDLVRKRLAADRARVQRSRWTIGATALAGVALAGVTAYRSHEPVIQIGETLLAAGFIVFLVRAWRKLAVAAPTGDASECVAYLRDRLTARLRATRGGWLAQAAPFFPGAAVLVAGLLALVGNAWLPKLGPIIALMAIWLGAMFLIQRRERSRLELEIAELDSLKLSQT